MQAKVSFLIATLNSAKILDECLLSIASQNYPKDLIEIIVADGGSTDATLEIAKKYGAKIVQNPLKTGEAGKMVALKHATGDLIALVDSDNILSDSAWLSRMTTPLEVHQDAVGSEPLSYTLRPQDGFIARYCALIGMNDPLNLFIGNYDRTCLITNKWTEVRHTEVDKGDYLYLHLFKDSLPTVGANGTIFRANFLKENVHGDYLFDIDILARYARKHTEIPFIKVKTGIVHTFCESDILKFARKQRRRIKDYLYHKSKNSREFKMDTVSKAGLGKFILYTLTVIPLLYQTLLGYSRKADSAWFFHPLACWITLWEYGSSTILSKFKNSELDRSKWAQ